MDLEDAEVVLDVEVAGELIFRLLQIVDKTHLDVSYQIIQRAWNDENQTTLADRFGEDEVACREVS